MTTLCLTFTQLETSRGDEVKALQADITELTAMLSERNTQLTQLVEQVREFISKVVIEVNAAAARHTSTHVHPFPYLGGW